VVYCACQGFLQADWRFCLISSEHPVHNEKMLRMVDPPVDNRVHIEGQGNRPQIQRHPLHQI
jgi:hypothetical protein